MPRDCARILSIFPRGRLMCARVRAKQHPPRRINECVCYTYFWRRRHERIEPLISGTPLSPNSLVRFVLRKPCLRAHHPRSSPPVPPLDISTSALITPGEGRCTWTATTSPQRVVPYHSYSFRSTRGLTARGVRHTPRRVVLLLFFKKHQSHQTVTVARDGQNGRVKCRQWL